MAKYLMIESSSGLVDSIMMWDGLIEEWNTSSGFILSEISETSSISFDFKQDSINFIFTTSSNINSTESQQRIDNAYNGTLPYIGLFTGSFTGSLTGSFNGWSGSLDWIGNFPTASWNTGSFSGSFTGYLNGTASHSETASYLDILKAGTVRFNEWGLDGTINNYYTSSVTFSSSYSNNSYAVSLTCGVDVRTLSVTNKTVSGFEINSNSSSTMSDNVYWITVPHNNP